ncbi:hypothetical protein N7488_011410 [Penicillium malachiteum]|nr:hypothetical protein N7488_011410 [Penicillium malachiteum]
MSLARSGVIDQDERFSPKPQTGLYTDSTREYEEANLEHLLRLNPCSIMWKAIDKDQEDQTVAAAFWLSPESYIEDDRELERLQEYPKLKCPPIPSTARTDVCQLFQQQISSARPLIWENLDDHWYLRLPATHPTYQRQGIARKLFEWGMNQAAIDQIPMYFMSTQQGLPLYQQYGVEILG